MNKLGIIGGSGTYNVDGLKNKKWVSFTSDFGEPSDSLLLGDIDGQNIVFLPRHGRNHTIPPNEINYRANIDILKKAGVTEIVSISAVGSLKRDLSPGTFVIVDQFIDRTTSREKSFFSTGVVAHVSMAHPTCQRMMSLILKIAEKQNIKIEKGGTYLAMQGPQFSSIAESDLYRHYNCDVIGMTNMPEVKLAREAEICYAAVAMVTDYDCWHPKYDNVNVNDVLKIMAKNERKSALLLKEFSILSKNLREPCPCGCQTALDGAIVTLPEHRDPILVKKLANIAGRVLNHIK